VLSTSPPVATHLAAAVLKKRHRIKWIADFRDPLLGNPFRTRKAAQVYDRAIETFILSYADIVLANTDTAAEMMRQRYPRQARKVRVLWNGYDPAESFGPSPLPQRDYRVIAHVGGLYGGRHPGVFLSSIERLIGRGVLDPSKIRIQLVGSLNLDDAWVKSKTFHILRDRGCLNYTEHRIPEPEARRVIAEADYLLLLDLNALDARVQTPAKLFDYLQVGRPILAFTAKESPAERILQKSGVPHGCVYSTDTPEYIDSKILDFFKLSTEPAPTSGWFKTHFSAPLQAKTLAALLDTL
jgi:glycosyltransferase involved in cell wall biosynthesis